MSFQCEAGFLFIDDVFIEPLLRAQPREVEEGREEDVVEEANVLVIDHRLVQYLI